jgi:putative hydrolase of the HAD superfamily
MTIKAVLFDLYGTLIDIETDESRDDIYRSIAHFLTYQGIDLHRDEVRDEYFRILKIQKEESREQYPEIDVEAVWNSFLKQHKMTNVSERKALSKMIAQLYRGISRKRLLLYPNVKNVLEDLSRNYRLAVVSDAQPCYVLPEIRAVGLTGFFDPVVISAEYGYRKPDQRLFQKALDMIGLLPSNVVFVGNDMFRDIFGAGRLGIKTIFHASNQGEKEYKNTIPDYKIADFADVMKGLKVLSKDTLPDKKDHLTS